MQPIKAMEGMEILGIWQFVSATAPTWGVRMFSMLITPDPQRYGDFAQTNVRRGLVAAIILAAALALEGCAARRGPPAAVENPAMSSPTPTRPTVAEIAPGATGREEKLPRGMPEIPAAGSVFFAFASAALSEQAIGVLRGHAERLKANPKQVVLLVAHTDSLGSPSIDVAVAEKRLDAVAELLVSLGVAKKQLRRSTMGNEEAPSGCEASCGRLMRRVDVLYQP